MEEGGLASAQDPCSVPRKTRFSGDTEQGQPRRGSVGRAVQPEGPVCPGAARVLKVWPWTRTAPGSAGHYEARQAKASSGAIRRGRVRTGGVGMEGI